jgi:hypothetical protein
MLPIEEAIMEKLRSGPCCFDNVVTGLPNWPNRNDVATNRSTLPFWEISTQGEFSHGDNPPVAFCPCV